MFVSRSRFWLLPKFCVRRRPPRGPSGPPAPRAVRARASGASRVARAAAGRAAPAAARPRTRHAAPGAGRSGHQREEASKVSDITVYTPTPLSIYIPCLQFLVSTHPGCLCVGERASQDAYSSPLARAAPHPSVHRLGALNSGKGGASGSPSDAPAHGAASRARLSAVRALPPGRFSNEGRRMKAGDVVIPQAQVA